MTTRRDLLTGATALVAAPLLPIGAMPAAAAARASDDTFRGLLAAYNAAVAELSDEPFGLTNEESIERFDLVGDKLTDLQERIAAEPALTVLGVFVKWRVLQPNIEGDFPEGGLFESIVKDIDRDLERLAGGGPA